MNILLTLYYRVILFTEAVMNYLLPGQTYIDSKTFIKSPKVNNIDKKEVEQNGSNRPD